MNVMSAALAYMIDGLMSITDYDGSNMLRTLVTSHREVVHSLQDLERGQANPQVVYDDIQRRRSSRTRRQARSPTRDPHFSSQHWQPNETPFVSSSFQQWDINPTQSTYVPFDQMVFEDQGTSTRTSYVSTSFNDASTSQTWAFNQPSIQYHPNFAHSQVSFNLSENIGQEERSRL